MEAGLSISKTFGVMARLSQSDSSRDHQWLGQTHNLNNGISFSFITTVLKFCLPVKHGMFYRQTKLQCSCNTIGVNI